MLVFCLFFFRDLQLFVLLDRLERELGQGVDGVERAACLCLGHRVNQVSEPGQQFLNDLHGRGDEQEDDDGAETPGHQILALKVESQAAAET